MSMCLKARTGAVIVNWCLKARTGWSMVSSWRSARGKAPTVQAMYRRGRQQNAEPDRDLVLGVLSTPCVRPFAEPRDGFQPVRDRHPLIGVQDAQAHLFADERVEAI